MSKVKAAGYVSIGPASAGLLALLLLLSPQAAFSGPSVYPRGVTVNKYLKAERGYTVFRADVPGTAYAIDMKGNVVKRWKNPLKSRLGPTVKPLPNGHILTEVGGYAGERFLIEMDWNSKVVWQFRMPVAEWWPNHDFERLPNGNTLVLTSNRENLPNIAPFPVQEDRIFEVDKQGNIVWMWRTSEHYDELDISAEGRKMIHDHASPYLDVDVFHTNSIQSIPKNPSGRADSRFAEGNILVSQRNTSLIFIIEKSTGKIVWHLNGCMNPDDPFIGQHHARMIPDGLEGAGNILLFDNGNKGGYPSKFRSYSRVLEINPRNCNLAWKYDGKWVPDGEGGMRPVSIRSFFSASRGSAQRLPNGNTLIAEAEWQRIFEVTKDKEIVWEYVYPKDVPPENYDNRQIYIYRGYRTGFGWPTGKVGPGSSKHFTW